MISNIAVNNRYIVAKYVRDLHRMEPRNIGLFLWANGKVTSRFVGGEDAKFIREPASYKRWRDFWSQLISGDEIEPIRGPAVSKATPEFMDALLLEQEGNYRLFDGGRVLDNLQGKDIDEAADFLFDQLVSRHKKTTAVENDTLKSLSDSLMEEAGLAERISRRTPIECPIYGTIQEIIVDYSLGNGHPEAVFQRVNLKTNLMSARGTALTFRSLRDAKKLKSKKHCCMLVDLNDPHAAPSIINMMKTVGVVANVAEPKKAIKAVRGVAKAAESG